MVKRTRPLAQASACAAKLKVLADPARLAVLEALMNGPMRSARFKNCWASSRACFPITCRRSAKPGSSIPNATARPSSTNWRRARSPGPAGQRSIWVVVSSLLIDLYQEFGGGGAPARGWPGFLHPAVTSDRMGPLGPSGRNSSSDALHLTEKREWTETTPRGTGSSGCPPACRF
jgi:hypothetical protein